RRWGLVLGILSAVGQDVVRVELTVDGLLIELADCRFAAQLPTGAVVDAVATLYRTLLSYHDNRSRLWVAWEQDRMAGVGKRRPLQGVMLGGKRPSGSLAVDPHQFLVHDFLASNVVADEVDQLPRGARENL